MKICFVSGEYPPMQGGVGDCTRQLGRALIQLGLEIHVVTSTSARGGIVNPQAHEPVVLPIVRRWDWTWWRTILTTMQQVQPDVLHIQYQTAAYSMHPAVNLLPLRIRLRHNRPKVVVTFHDLRVPYLFPKAGRAREWANLCLARLSDAAITTNQQDLDRLVSAHLATSLRLIPIGSNIQPVAPLAYDRAAWRSRFGVTPGEILLCYFGFLNESKGGETLFRSLAELNRRGRKAKLLMIGGQVGDSDPTNEAYFEYIKTLGTELSLEGQVRWTGYIPAEDVSGCFSAADTCVLPYNDGVSLRRGSLMAALAHGMPVVSTIPGKRDTLLLNGENIILVPPGDPRATADAVERIADLAPLRSRLSRGARRLAQEFSWEHIAAETLQLYDTLCA